MSMLYFVAIKQPLSNAGLEMSEHRIRVSALHCDTFSDWRLLRGFSQIALCFHLFFSILSFTTLICFLCNLHPFLPPYNENAYLHIIYLSFCKSIRTEELLLRIAEIDDLADHSVHRNICHLPHISTSCGRYNC
ncbi:unnamed protein product [Albugo candida]|uniref:Uncharacterized protein n=1 Tax=Albugo candida TaxID=65357 RepID=A0A024FUI1_9STRA|nr:unnamed protein product [Albugo candida]|eukprot:CCI10696.1 unnamed protein product [Albugo candida]